MNTKKSDRWSISLDEVRARRWCTNCRNPLISPQDDGYFRCEHCREQRRIKDKERNERRGYRRDQWLTENHRCRRCGKPLTNFDKKTCEACLAEEKERRDNRIQNRQCRICGAELPEDCKWKTCDKCRFAEKVRCIKRAERYKKELQG